MIPHAQAVRRSASRALLLAAAAWFCCGSAASAGSIPYERLLRLSRAAEFEAIPLASRDKVLFVCIVSHRDKMDKSPVHMWVMDGGARTDIAVDAHGRFHMPVRADWLARHLDVQTDQPAGSLQIEYDITLAPPQGLVIPVAYLRDGLAQVQEIVRQAYRKAGGYLAQLAAPRFTRVTISFARCCGETAVLRNDAGQSVMQENEAGKILVPAEALQTSGAGTLTLSSAGLVFDPE